MSCTGSCVPITATCASSRAPARRNFRCGCRSSSPEPMEETHDRVQPSGRDPECDAAHEGVRRVFEDGRSLGAPAPVHELRPRGLLRFVEEQTRDEALSPDEAPDYAIA